MLFVLIRTTDSIELVSLTLIVKNMSTHRFYPIWQALMGEGIKPLSQRRRNETPWLRSWRERDPCSPCSRRIRAGPSRPCTSDVLPLGDLGVRCWPNDYSNKQTLLFCPVRHFVVFFSKKEHRNQLFFQHKYVIGWQKERSKASAGTLPLEWTKRRQLVNWDLGDVRKSST